MRAFRSVGLVMSAGMVLAGCATRLPPPPRLVAQGDCAFVVVNHTPHALELRRVTRGTSSRWLGSINPGELLTDATACGEGQVRVWGVAVPQQVGAPANFRAIYGTAALRRGERALITFHWP